MPTVIELPQIGESVVEGIIGQWHKKPGDKLERYEPLVEVVTDKVTTDIPCPFDGVLIRILAEEGATVPMGAPIAEAETDEVPSPTKKPTAPKAPEAAPTEVSTVGYLVKDVKAVGPTGGGPAEEGEAEAEAVAVAEAPAPTLAPAPVEAPKELDRKRYSPAVRRLAQEHGVDLGQVQGTGIGGRVTRADVEAFIQRGAPAAAPAVRPVRTEPQPVGADEEAMPLTPIRRIIADNMTKSATQIPHAWSMVEVDVTPIVRYRESVKEEFRLREGVSLTYLPFVIKAVVEALKESPRLNSSWGGDKVLLKRRMNIGIAVAAPEGLVVPVIHDADSLSISGLARACSDLTDRARQGKLALNEVQGGTFTVNNTGALGTIVSKPIINYPQAAILTSEAIQKRPIVVGDAIAIRSLMNVCLSFDHRIVDGAEAGQFLNAVKRLLEAMGPDTPIY